VNLIGNDQRITSGPAVKRPHSKAEYMTAPERFADSQIPLAPRAPSIHDPMRSQAGSKSRSAAVPPVLFLFVEEWEASGSEAARVAAASQPTPDLKPV